MSKNQTDYWTEEEVSFKGEPCYWVWFSSNDIDKTCRDHKGRILEFKTKDEANEYIKQLKESIL